MRPSLRHIQLALLCVIFGAVVYGVIQWFPTVLGGGTPVCKGCNVILISIDTLGAKHTSVGNPDNDTTPFLKELAERKAVVFDNAYVQAPWTLPSHTAMLTGKYPWDLNMWLPSDILPDAALTIAEQMKGAGYLTAAFSNGAFVRPGWGFDQGFDQFYGSVAEADWEDTPKIFIESAAWVAEQDRSTPFFLFMHTFGVHDPYVKDGDDAVRIKDIVTANLTPNGPAAADTERFKEYYRDGVAKTDIALQDFFSALQSAGVLDNTIVIITSDHGEEFGEHGTTAFHAVTTYREVLHVPLVVITPRGSARHVADSVEVRSIPATILELVELPKNYTIAPSLVPAMSGVDLGDAVVRSATGLSRTELLHNFEHGYGAFKLVPTTRTTPFVGSRTTSVIQGSLHAIKKPDGVVEAYNMSDDPDEKSNLAATATAPDAFKSLLEALEKLAHE